MQFFNQTWCGKSRTTLDKQNTKLFNVDMKEHVVHKH